MSVGTGEFGNPFPIGFSPADTVTVYSRCPGDSGPGFACDAGRFWLVYDGVAQGNYPLTMATTSGTTVHTESVTLSVTTPPFALSVSPAALTIAQGSSQDVVLVPSGYGVGSSTIYNTLENLPAGVKAAPTNNSDGSVTVSLTSESSLTPGTYIVTAQVSQGIYVSGYSAPAAILTASAQFSLTIGSPTPQLISRHRK